MKSRAQIDSRTTFATFAIVAGLLSFLLVASVSGPAPRVPAELLPYFVAHRSTYVFLAITVLVWAVASVPCTAGIGVLLGARRDTLAFAATILCSGGVLLLGFGTFVFVGAFLAIIASSQVAPSEAEATYQATIWGNLSYLLTDPGLMTLGLGQFLFAWLAWKGGALPKVLSGIGFVGGLAGLCTLAVYQTSLLAVIQISAFGVWGLTTGVMLLRRSDEKVLTQA
jgi:hypothetical protein